MEPADLFSSILQDPDTMQKLAGIASELMATPPSDAPSAPTPPPQPSSDMGADVGAGADLMRQLTPALSIIAKSGQNSGNPARVQLLSALKPFVSPHTRKQIDHAEHLLRMARMAQAATEQFMPQIFGGREA